MFENPDGWKIIYDENRTILGFWQLLPLTEEGFQMAVHGQICADRIEDRIVPKLMPGNWHNGYFYSLSICPTIRRSLVAFGFGGTIIKSLINLAKKEIYYDHLTVCFATRYSQALNRTGCQRRAFRQGRWGNGDSIATTVFADRKRAGKAGR